MSERQKEISDEDLENFCAVTGANKERARFYVEAAGGNLDLAIESFYEGGGGGDGADSIDDDVQMISESKLNVPKGFGAGLNHDDSDEDEEDDLPARNPFNAFQAKKPEVKKLPAKSSGAKIFGLSNLRDEENEEDDDEKGQAFYAGGSQASGQQILGPSKKNPEKIIKDLFQKAKESGAQEVDLSEGTSSKKGPVVYGTGYRLGTGTEPSEVIKGPSKPKQPKSSVLKLYKNGFVVDDGELRSYEDEKNKEFLQSIQRGELPRELIRMAEGGEVHLDMQDHREEEYEPPKPKYKLFNDGYKLGSPTPSVTSTASPTDKASSEELAKKNLKLDASQPVTQIQIRLSDGSRLIIKANHKHTVQDLRRYINTARPEYGPRFYSLLTQFPNKELTDESETIEQAKLQNSVIVQKLKL